MRYIDIKAKYEDAGCIDCKLRDSFDLKNVLDIEIDKIEYWDELSTVDKQMVEVFTLTFLNSCGLEYREGFKVTKAYLCNEYELIHYGKIVGHKIVNINNSQNPIIESLSTPDNYSYIENECILKPFEISGCTTFLRVDLVNSDGGKEWFHVTTSDT